MMLDADAAYRALRGRDARFDGQFFVGVSSTGIYCRPSCPARTPLRRNAGFYPSAAAAQRAGFRACKRCRPDATPGSAAWNVQADLAGRAARLIADGVIDRAGVTGLARQLGFSERQVSRALLAELGAPPLALARAHRAQTARMLLESTLAPIADVAFAAGFGSIRQFNDTMQEIFASTPSQLRDRAKPSSAPDADPHSPATGSIGLRLAYRAPMNVETSLNFLAGRMITGVEDYDGQRYQRTLRLPYGHALVAIEPGDGFLRAQLQLTDQRDLAAAVARIRRWLDLDSDPVAVDETLSNQPIARGMAARRPGLRAVGAVDGFEMAIRAVVGQQISVAGARKILAVLVERYGTDCAVLSDRRWRVFPTAAAVAAADPVSLPMTRARARTVVALAQAVATGALDLAPGADRMQTRHDMLAITGIGPWTADYVLLRAMADPDIFMATDLVIKRQLQALPELDIGAAAPWRSYLTHHLWAASLGI